MNIGYVGLGALGRELALCFQEVHQLMVWDISPVVREQLASAGVEVAESPAALARQSDVVLLCLPRSADVQQLIFGPGGLLEGLTPGKLLIDQTSGTPAETAKIARELASHGVAMLDTAVSANPQVVRSGGATLMVGGPDALVERAMPVLKTITSTIRRCGSRVGDGQAMKLINNAIFGAIRLGTLEIATLGCKAGLTLEQMEEAWCDGVARSWATEKMLQALLRGEASTNFALSLMLKDLNQAMDFGLAHDAPMPLAGLTRALLQIGLNTQGQQARLEDMNGVIETLTGARLNDALGQTNGAEAERLQALEKSLAAIGLAATLECVSAALKYGLELSAVKEVLVCSSGYSAAGEAWINSLNKENSVNVQSVLSWVEAQRQTFALAMQYGAPAVLSTAAHDFFASAAAEFGADAGLAGLTKFHAKKSGLQLGVV